MSNYKVLISDPLPSDAREILEATGQIEVVEGFDKIEESLPTIHGWIVRSGTQITADYLERAPQLKCVCRAGAGVDNIDIAAAKARGVVVMNTPGSNSLAAAELTVGLFFALARHIPFAHSIMASGGWGRKNFVGVELEGKTLGVLGLGKVGAIVARKGRALGMNVLGYDPFVNKESVEGFGVKLCTVEEILPQADFLAVHTPLTEDTRGFLGRKNFARCKSDVRIVNCSRGGVVDEEALIEALDNGTIGCAALDVYAEEPPAEDSPLRNHPKIITTPHLGASSVEAQARVGIVSGEQIRDCLLTGEARNTVG